MGKPNKLSTAELEAAYLEFKAGGVSMAALGRRYGVSETALPFHFKKLGWKGPGKNPYKYELNQTEFECGTCKKVKAKNRFSVSNRLRGLRREVHSVCKDCAADQRRFRLYKMELGQYSQLKAEQLGKCAVCKIDECDLLERNKKLVVDHCHRTGVVRGLLCDLCNLTVAAFENASKADVQAYIAKRKCSITIAKKHRAAPVGYNTQDAHVYRTYGLTTTQYEELYRLQTGLCACCRQEHLESKKYPRLLVEHCHITGAIGGLCCVKCNIAMVGLDRNPGLLEAGYNYLEKA